MPALLGMVLLIPAIYFAFNMSSPREMRLSKELSSVAPQLTGYQSNESKGAVFYQDPGAETEFARIYSSPAGEAVELYIGFRGRQQGDKRLQSPKLRFPYGWNYVWVEPASVAVAGHPPISASWMLTQNSQIRVLVLYWYQNGDDTFSGEVEKRLNLVRSSLLRSRSDGAVVRLATPVADIENIDQAKSRLTAFAIDLYPRLRRVLPQ